MPAQVGTFVLPRPTVLPAQAVRGQIAYVDGAVWSFDGTVWGKGGGAVVRRVVVDVGVRGRREHTVVIDADVAVGDRVNAWLDYQPTPAKVADEFDLDAVHVWCAVRAAGRLTIRLTGLTGLIAGQFGIDYSVAKG